MAKLVKFSTNHTDAQLAYLAGIIDGEGCFFIGKSKTSAGYGIGFHYHSLIRVSNCDECLIIWLENTFGGSKDSRYRFTSKLKYYRPVFNWQASGAMLDYLCPLILPYLVIKPKHCKVMMEIRKTYHFPSGKPLTNEVISQRDLLMQAMRKLNSRFHDHPLKQESLPLVTGS